MDIKRLSAAPSVELEKHKKTMNQKVSGNT